MDMLEMKINDFLDKLESSDAVPGGGGASALAAALGSSLGTMVGSLTVGKKKYADVEEDIKALMAEMTELSDKLAACVNKDAELFAPLAEAYSIPKDAPGRDETLEKCLRDAASAPFDRALRRVRGQRLETGRFRCCDRCSSVQRRDARRGDQCQSQHKAHEG